MRKFVLFLMVFSVVLLTMSSAFAEVNLLGQQTKGSCVVIVGNASVKTPDFFQYIDEAFNSKDNNNKKVAFGTEIQSLYQTYWLDKGFLEEQKPTKQDLNDFVKYSGYNKVLFLIINTPVVEKTKQGGGGWGTWSVTEKTRASIGLKAFLTNENSVIKATDVTKEDDSFTSELRAKRGAFKKCMEEIKTIISPLI